ncbi:putative aldouronate transport system permease protein [Pseudobutyrivibrio sp. 49]|uniref:carbohydrate ABC transporter permease n=1 Tax=unclassified Pseudobutyrivibrio TaxID=2638619 RepID=UPI0008820D8D|nr:MULTISPECIES: carbohydrate ABC transporter permease [unclassified Pseudobutyrivibrio]SDI18646.1 putative aldouronate transport system permease protein [Pseudobutyrivibrio sp. 49]SFN62187.1 putative aldouronate transport system permease protein [Pseudobutyrivibrio sp. UC1225]
MAKELVMTGKINTKGFARSKRRDKDDETETSRMVKSDSTKAGDIVFITICVIISLICIIPMINLLARSLSASDFLVRREVYLIPKGLNISAYSTVLGDPKYIKSFVWTVILTVICTFLSLTMTVLCAYPLIFNKLKGRSIFNIVITITMFFNAGTIPNYLLMKELNLLDNPLVLIVPGCLSVYNMIIMRSFFYGIPDSLRESAEIDGASFFRILWSIYLPLSKPVIATLALFYAVGRWNGYSDALMYMKNKDFYPLQLLLYNILNNMNSVEVATQEGFSTPGLSESLKAAIVMFSTIPILCIYPFLQKYFIHGVTLGAVKE